MNFTVSKHRHDDEPMRSITGSIPIFVVPLRWFAFHFLTAYVEGASSSVRNPHAENVPPPAHRLTPPLAAVNVTRWNGIEHPMWGVVPVKSNGWLGRFMFDYCDTCVWRRRRSPGASGASGPKLTPRALQALRAVPAASPGVRPRGGEGGRGARGAQRGAARREPVSSSGAASDAIALPTLSFRLP